MGSKSFGPTDSVADTLTQVGSNYQMPPEGGIIYALRVSKGNVVNAKEICGFIHVVTVKRTYDFAYGNGQGGATNSHSGPAEIIKCAIFVPSNTILKIYVLDATAAKDVIVSAQWKDGGSQNKFKTMAAGGITGSADSAADTEEDITSSSKLTGAELTPEENGRIYQIRFAGAGVVDAKAGSAKLEVLVKGQSGPFEYAVGNGAGGATLGGPNHADVIDIPEGIPVKSTSAINVKITSAEAMKNPSVSLSYW